jgi:hypothetical protein
MTLQMLVHFRLALQNVQRHLLELRDALFGKQHLDSAHVRGAVEAPENYFRHEFVTSVLERPNHLFRASRIVLGQPVRGFFEDIALLLR